MQHRDQIILDKIIDETSVAIKIRNKTEQTLKSINKL